MIIIKNQAVKSFEEVNEVLKDIGQQVLGDNIITGVEKVSGTVSDTWGAANAVIVNELIGNLNQLVDNIRKQ